MPLVFDEETTTELTPAEAEAVQRQIERVQQRQEAEELQHDQHMPPLFRYAQQQNRLFQEPTQSTTSLSFQNDTTTYSSNLPSTNATEAAAASGTPYGAANEQPTIRAPPEQNDPNKKNKSWIRIGTILIVLLVVGLIVGIVAVFLRRGEDEAAQRTGAAKSQPNFPSPAPSPSPSEVSAVPPLRTTTLPPPTIDAVAPVVAESSEPITTPPLPFPMPSPFPLPSKPPSPAPTHLLPNDPAASPSFSSPEITQVGPALIGENEYDFSGTDVALVSNETFVRIVVGASHNDGDQGLFNTGHVRVYDWNDQTWQQLGSDLDADASCDWFGHSVDIAASQPNRIVIGATRTIPTKAGYVQVFDWNTTDGIWEQVGPTLFGNNDGDNFGGSVAISADGYRIVVGAWGNDGPNGEESGRVRVFDWTPTTASWEPVGFALDGAASVDHFGRSVAISSDGNRIAAGANEHDGGNGADFGHVRVFDWTGAAWERAGPDIDGEASGDEFGAAVAMSADGNRIVVGAYWNDGANGKRSGHARVFGWSESNTTWEQIGSDIDGEGADDNFGTSVAISADGNRIAVGARLNDNENGWNSGHVRIFDWTGSSWDQLESDIDGEYPCDDFGKSVAMSPDGTKVAVSGPGHDGNGYDSGFVRVFALPV